MIEMMNMIIPENYKMIKFKGVSVKYNEYMDAWILVEKTEEEEEPLKDYSYR